ncbi:MAG: ABC transporter ATP-binding protein [Desulfobulbaceae bacterium]|nr:ABC transporter ATP-binding protein [Desulfobulbaceae bacterium]
MNSPPLFDIKKISFSYGSTPAVNQVDTRLYSGKFYGIIGPNGCGKTTLLDLLTGSKSPQSGVLQLQGSLLEKIPKRDLAKLLALVPQEYDTGFGYTVEEVVLMGRHPHIDRFASPGPEDWQAVNSALKDIGIDDLRDRYTNTLSGGQKQRAVVARALAQNSPTLLFDEATSSLDIKYTIQIFNIARDLVKKQKRTVIAVIHDLNLAAAYCDEILFMQEGRIAFNGTTKEILTAENIAAIFGVESHVESNPKTNSLRVSFQY